MTLKDQLTKLSPIKNQPAKFPPLIFVLFAVLLWSTGGLFIKLTTLDPAAVNGGRSLLAAATVAGFTYRKGLKLTGFTLLTAFVYAGTLTSFVYATKLTTAANAIFLQYTAPVYILILSPLLLKEKFRAVDLVTIVFCLAGMGLFFFEPANTEEKLATVGFLGNLFALVSGALFGLLFVLMRHPRSLASKNPAGSAFYGNLLVVLLMLPVLIVRPPQPTTGDLLAISYLGVFQLGISYLLFTYGMVGGARPFDASIIGFVEPLLNPVWVFLAVNETPTRWAIIGGAVIILTVAAHTLISSRRRLTPAKI